MNNELTLKQIESRLAELARAAGIDEQPQSKVSFGRTTIHAGKICLAFYVDHMLFMYVTDLENRKRLFKLGAGLLPAPNSTKTRRVMPLSTTSLSDLQVRASAKRSVRDYEKWLQIPDDIFNDDHFITALIKSYKPTLNYKGGRGNADDIVVNPNTNASLVRYLAKCGITNIAQIKSLDVVELYLKLEQVMSERTLSNIRRDTIRRLIGLHEGSIYSWVPDDRVEAVLASVHQIQETS